MGRLTQQAAPHPSFGSLILSTAMASQFSTSQALSIRKDVVVGFVRCTNSGPSIGAPPWMTFLIKPEARLKLKLKLGPEPEPEPNGPCRPRRGAGRRLQIVGSGLKPNGVRCGAATVAVNDLADNVQQQATLQIIRSSRVIACLRASSSKVALDAARAALDGGLTVLEVTMNTPQAAQVLKVLMQEYPSATIGAGTVLSTKDVNLAKDAGAKFLLSPVTVEDIVRDHVNGPVLHIPGAMTPTEVISAYNLGALAVKLYPMSLLGGVSFMRTLSKPLGHIPMVPSNGISLDMVEPYISAGAMAVILSEAIFEKSALEKYDMLRVRKLASAAVLRTTFCQSSLIHT